jgi:lysophospholipase L1-like esterase
MALSRLLLLLGLVTLIGGCGGSTFAAGIVPASTGHVVALGDSLTYGHGNGANDQWFGPPQPHSYPWDMEADLGMPVVNAGITGTTAYSVLHPETLPCCPRPVEYQLPALLAQHPRLIVVGFGTNEANYRHPIAQTVADFQLLLYQIANAGVPIVLFSVHVDCTVQPCTPPGQGETAQVYTTAWDQALTSLAAQYHAGLVLDIQHGFTSADMTDWIHCNAQGYQKMANQIEPAVRSKLGI